jgi:hypothetical protein
LEKGAKGSFFYLSGIGISPILHRHYLSLLAGKDSGGVFTMLYI